MNEQIQQTNFLETPKEKWQREYHEANPHIYEKFIECVKHLREHGYKRAGARQVLEIIRYQTAVRAKQDIFKINNNMSAFYSRKFMADFPEQNGFFKIREHSKDVA